MVYSGILWLTAGGNEDQVADAKQRIKNAVIGMLIALSAFIITNFVVQSLSKVLDNGGGAAAPATPRDAPRGGPTGTPADQGNNAPTNNSVVPRGGQSIPTID